MDLVVEIYRLSKAFPRDEQFGLTNQVRRAAVSVPANIAEGYGRLRKGDFLRFLSISRGSLAEVEAHLQIAFRLDYLKRDDLKPVWSEIQEVGRLLNGLIRSLENSEWQSNGNGRISESGEEYETDSRLLTPDSFDE
jgi:four helix bundle protein